VLLEVEVADERAAIRLRGALFRPMADVLYFNSNLHVLSWRGPVRGRSDEPAGPLVLSASPTTICFRPGSTWLDGLCLACTALSTKRSLIFTCCAKGLAQQHSSPKATNQASSRSRSAIASQHYRKPFSRDRRRGMQASSFMARSCALMKFARMIRPTSSQMTFACYGPSLNPYLFHPRSN
jgi:hypothetical protein